MSAALWEAATVNAFSTTLNGSITDSDTTITLTSVIGLVAPGVLVIDRQDANEVDTPTTREYITFTGISSNDLTGVSRGVAGSTAQAHSSGALVEENMSVTHWNELIDFLQTSFDASGNITVSSTATIASVRISTHLNASGASITGTFPLHPVWVFDGAASTPSVGIGKPLPMPGDGSLRFLSAMLNGPASGATIVLDANNGLTSIFDAVNRLMIPAGGTYASTASIASPVFVSGNSLSIDLDTIGNTVNNVGMTIVGGS